MFWRSKRSKKRHRGAANFLRVERLEPRHLLSGVVNVEIAPGAGITPGNLTLVGDTANNSVMLQADPTMQGRYIITGTGANQTLLQINGGGVTLQTVTINGINGVINVNLGGGNDTFDFEGPTGGGTSNAPVDVDITNNAGSDVNIFNNVFINGNLNVTKANGAIGYSELDLTNTTVVGATIVNNVGAAGPGGATGGGDSLTQITGSTLEGGAANTALQLTNDQGNAIVQVQGTTQFGEGVAVAAPPVVTINNGSGGSRTSFAGTATVYGGLGITNGDSLPGQLELVTFNQTQVLGTTTINNGTGANNFSDTKVIVTNSSLGTQFAIPPATATPAPVTLDNNSGFDSLTVTGSQAPWGMSVNNDLANGGASNWGSTTSISTSSFGNRIGGPALPTPGDALQISGDNAADAVSVSTSTIGGVLDLGALRNGNNTVTLDSNTMGSLRVVTGTGNDSLKLLGGSIQSAIFVDLGAGNDTMELRNGGTPINNSTVPVLPSPLLGAISINGGLGIDTFKSDTGLVIPPDIMNFEFFVSP